LAPAEIPLIGNTKLLQFTAAGISPRESPHGKIGDRIAGLRFAYLSIGSTFLSGGGWREFSCIASLGLLTVVTLTLSLDPGELLQHRAKRGGVLAVAALLGGEFRLVGRERAGELAGAPLLDAIEEATRARVVQPLAGAAGTYSFTHALMRETLYDELGLEQAAAATRALLAPESDRARGHPAYPDGLSAREVEVLRFIAVGRSNREIAARLVISVNTVVQHVRGILNKTACANRTEAAAYAVRHGLVE